MGWKKIGDPEFNILFFTIVIVIIVVFTIFFPDYSKIIEGKQGLISITTLIVAIILHYLLEWKEEKKHLEKQLSILRSLLVKIEYLGGKSDMELIGGFKRISHVKWFSEISEIKAHKALELNADFFVLNLDHKIKNKSTQKLKNTLYFIDEKVNTINHFNQKRFDLFIGGNTAGVKICNSFIEAAVNDLKKEIPKVKEYIEKEFEIS